ncbi:hypothetical protein LOZ53_001775 [Ophidiomyces ophidiicola]|uniref:Uncharacterized protein n=1 Tax=Ophidiomyces ophidiicola TaxID=1387563 RepID=A0ACB8UWQ4_9EURO|nr:hypothetical protein LOZ62_003695 [Ophidiomyces ophidiicola]KAI1971640.1 hypothetical protein LOZ56_002927 [Ophidiomyces ophidiicola]KAI1976497.1 hypothetical protein LOZ55_004299 [Ophidiomyces ophidiicola]KAI1982564.1 hypothetical protein LOZ54_005369 [Ophidiomyces ophidiicola]KAI1988942.1 hypothetical protein LOZ51_005333 [Ophidiomyces ophidiicola]
MRIFMQPPFASEEPRATYALSLLDTTAVYHSSSSYPTFPFLTRDEPRKTPQRRLFLRPQSILDRRPCRFHRASGSLFRHEQPTEYAFELLHDAFSLLMLCYSVCAGRNQGTPLTAWLRVPLPWYQSFTRSFFPDETHASIKRIFTPETSPQSKHAFCGFCGTPLTFWTENPPEEAEYMSVAVGSLSSDDQNTLEDLDLIPRDADLGAIVPSNLTPRPPASPPRNLEETQVSVSHHTGTVYGIPWFEEMIQGSRLGRVGKHRRGFGSSADRSVQVEWEVTEWHEASGDLVAERPGHGSEVVRTSSKRKNPEVG